MPVRSTSALILTAPKSPALMGAKAPPNLPTAVRIGATIAARRKLELDDTIVFSISV
jgi:hypothetical protein